VKANALFDALGRTPARERRDRLDGGVREANAGDSTRRVIFAALIEGAGGKV
jgi:hypothetical protein